jgi:hypothetical protein
MHIVKSEPVSEATLLKVRIKLEGLISERQAMIVLNTERESNGHAMAYDEEAFFDIQQRIEELLEELQ